MQVVGSPGVASALCAEAEGGEAAVETGDLPLGVDNATAAAGPRRMSPGVDIEFHHPARLAPGRARPELRAIGHHHGSQMPRGPYRVNLRADLVCSRFVEPGERKRLDGSQCRLPDELGNEGKTVDEYRDVVRKIRG